MQSASLETANHPQSTELIDAHLLRVRRRSEADGSSSLELAMWISCEALADDAEEDRLLASLSAHFEALEPAVQKRLRFMSDEELSLHMCTAFKQTSGNFREMVWKPILYLESLDYPTDESNYLDRARVMAEELLAEEIDPSDGSKTPLGMFLSTCSEEVLARHEIWRTEILVETDDGSAEEVYENIGILTANIMQSTLETLQATYLQIPSARKIKPVFYVKPGGYSRVEIRASYNGSPKYPVLATIPMSR